MKFKYLLPVCVLVVNFIFFFTAWFTGWKPFTPLPDGWIVALLFVYVMVFVITGGMSIE